LDTPENPISRVIVDAAMDVHSILGPGLLESCYVAALAHELDKRGLAVRRQVHIPGRYKGIPLGLGFRADLIVDNMVIVEVKSASAFADVHAKQLLTYLRQSELRLGLLLNFGLPRMREGILRMVNGLPENREARSR